MMRLDLDADGADFKEGDRLPLLTSPNQYFDAREEARAELLRR